MNWINRSDKLPTENDADRKGNVLGWDVISNEANKFHFTDVIEMQFRFTHWAIIKPPKTP